jgi:hypothetical protein
MESCSAMELHAWADLLERRRCDPDAPDDAGWLRRWSKRLRYLAEQKEKAREHKAAH